VADWLRLDVGALCVAVDCIITSHSRYAAEVASASRSLSGIAA
jgi:hypothetical protein